MIIRKIRNVAYVLIFFVLFVFVGKILRYLVVNDVSSYTRIAFHEMYEQDNIDVLFVGSSHCYRSFVPEILDKELGCNTFNVGTSSQYMDGSYMLIKENIRNNKLEHIYLEIYFGCATDVKEERTQAVSTYIISDYLKPSLDKVKYLLKATNKEHYMNSFVVARRDWTKLFDADYVIDLIIKKNSEAYKNYDYSYVSHGVEWYAGKGYVANEEVVNGWNYFSTRAWNPFEVSEISQDWKNDLENVINYCANKQVGLTLVVAPMSNFFLAGMGNYDEYISYVRSIAKEKNIEFYDFNLCKEEYFPNVSEVFKDEDHLNCYGAEIFSHSFAKLVNGEVSEEEMFYNSYDEKMEKLPVTVYGVTYKSEMLTNGAAVKKCRIVTNKSEGVEYAVSVVATNGEEFSIKDFSEEVCFDIDSQQKGNCKISYRLIENPETIYELQVTIS